MKEISTKGRQRNNTCIIQKIKTRLTQIKLLRGGCYTFFKSDDKRKFEENKTRLQNVRQKASISKLSCRAAVSAMLYQTKNNINRT